MTSPFRAIDETKPVIPTDIGGADEVVEDFGDSKTTFRFKRLKDREPGQAWILLYYGASKSGKTYFAGTAGPRTLFINIGEGIETLMAPSFTSRYPEAADMITVDVREAGDAATAFDMITSAIDHALKHFGDRFDNIVLDEATSLRKFALNKAMDLNTSVRKTGAPRKSRKDEYVKAEIGDFGVEMDMIEWFLGEYVPIFKEHNKNFLMLAHERQIFSKPEKIGDEPALKRVLPGFTGKTFPDKVPAFFDDVWHSEVAGSGVNVVYRARTAGNELELGGARHGGIFEVLERDPNFLKMLSRIKLAQPLKRK